MSQYVKKYRSQVCLLYDAILLTENMKLINNNYSTRINKLYIFIYRCKPYVYCKKHIKGYECLYYLKRIMNNE